MKLFFGALTKFICGVLLVGALVFLPAGTLDYINGWVFAGVLFLPMLLLGAVLLIKAPSLLQKRLDSKEKNSDQRVVVALSALVFLAGFVAAGLDYRFGLSEVPMAVVIAAAVLFLFSYALYAQVMRENAYLSRTVKVEEGQKVVDTGLYGIVRHPMYMATVIMFLSIPLILGSWISFALFLFYPIIIAFRIRGEERLLCESLDGYVEYKKKVRYRLIPFVW